MKEITVLSVLLLLVSPAFATDLQEYKDNSMPASNETSSTETSKHDASITYQEPTGVQVVFNEDGKLKKLLASGEAELKFGDKKDERQALQKATMRAKAAIAKFMNETIKSTETLEEIQKTVSNSTTEGNKTSARDTVETQIEMIENKAEELLLGVVTLQQDIDRDRKVVTVTVGMKEQTIQAAGDLQGQIAASEISKPLTPSSNKANDLEQSGKEIRRSKAMENF